MVIVPRPSQEPAPPLDTAEPHYVRVAFGLRSMILAGELRPGAWIRMTTAAERFHVSVQPVREALQLLQGEGLVDIHPNRGARVRGLDRRRLIAIYETRAAIEGHMARLFATEAAPSQLRAVEAAQIEHERATDAGDHDAMVVANRAFHALINGHGGNGEALAIIRRHNDLLGMLRQLVGFGPPSAARVRTEHRALIEAFRAHDGPRADDIGARHVLGALDDILRQLDLSRSVVLRAARA